jgi:hypothetical protein
MKNPLAAALALLTIVAFAACSSSASNASTDSGANSAASDSSATSSSSDSTTAASNSGAAPVYPGAAPADKSSYGTPPPGGKLYVTNDDPVTVGKWYVTNGAKESAPTTAKGGLLLMGDQNTGTFITLIGEGGKTYIQILPASAAK